MEYTLGGNPDRTFGQLCIEVAPRDEEWDAYDVKGNVITNKELSEYDGLVELGPKATQKKQQLGRIPRPQRRSMLVPQRKVPSRPSVTVAQSRMITASTVFYCTIAIIWTLASVFFVIYAFQILLFWLGLAVALVVSGLLLLHLSALTLPVFARAGIKVNRKKYGALVFPFWFSLSLFVAWGTYLLVGGMLAPTSVWLLSITAFGTANSLVFGIPSLEIPSFEVRRDMERVTSFIFSLSIVGGWTLFCILSAVSVFQTLSWLGSIAVVISVVVFLHLDYLLDLLKSVRIGLASVFGLSKKKYGVVVFSSWLILSFLIAGWVCSPLGGATPLLIAAYIVTWLTCFAVFGILNSLLFDVPLESYRVVGAFRRIFG